MVCHYGGEILFPKVLRLEMMSFEFLMHQLAGERKELAGEEERDYLWIPLFWS